jgi:RHS repeat-associated protein
MTGAFGEEIVQYKGFQTVADIGEDAGRRVYLGAYRYRAGGELLIHPDGSKEVNFTDNNGSVRLVVHSDGSKEHFDYKPFGDTLWTSSGTMNRDNFDGSTYDSESDLQMLGFRMYDNETGRFTTPDLLWSAFPAQTPYHYAYNSPLTYRDPSGLAPEKEKEREELQSEFVPEYYTAGIEVNASRDFSQDMHDFLYESFQIHERNKARLAEMQDWWMNSVYNWKGPARTTDYVTLKGNAKLSPNPKDKAKITKVNLTKVFNEHLDKLAIFFKNEKLKFEKDMDKNDVNSYKLRELLRILRFGEIQWKGKDTEFINPKQSNTFKEGGIYNSEEFSKDDFGNYAYGVAAREFGVNWVISLWGGGAFSSYNHYMKGTTEKIQFSNLFNLGDDWSDSFMIFKGYMVGSPKK